MNYEEKKNYLSCFSVLDANIDALIREKEKWYKRALSLKTADTDVDGRGNEILNKVIMLEKEIDENIDKLVDMRKEISEKIENIDDFTLKQILYLKYLNGLPFMQIGEKLMYSERQISRLHKKAINMLIL